MNSKRIWWALGIAAVLIGAAALISSIPRPNVTPADDVRAAVQGIGLSEVKACDILSHSIYLQLGTDPTRVTDRESISLLLTGLKEASYPEPFIMNRVDSITLILKDGRRVGPFAFSTDREVDAFSPEFVKGLEREGIALRNR